MPDIGISIVSNLLFTKEDNLDSGIYIYTKTKITSDLSYNIAGFIELYKEVFEFFNIEINYFINVELEFGLFITNINIGYIIKHPKLNIECIYNFKIYDLSCKINEEKHFKVNIYEGIKYITIKAYDYVIKKSTKVFNILKEEFKKKFRKNKQ